jgi:hypothetical protein
MNISRRTLVSSLWFALEVIGIFLIIQLTRYLIGNLNAFYSGLSLILISSVLFLFAYFVARSREKRHKKPGTKFYTGLFS